MSKNILRKDKTCLNCKYVVENKFCPNCGQENNITRKTFQHLFLHFFEDLTHYENAFWKTIKNLLFKPGTLTKEYLSGKRLSYLAPVRLYIFISFMTFFLIAVLPNSDKSLIKVKQITTTSSDKNGISNVNTVSEKEISLDELLETNFKGDFSNDSLKKIKAKLSESEIKELESLLKSEYLPQLVKDSIVKKLKERKEIDLDNGFLNFGYKSIKELDSLQKYAKNPDDKLNKFEYWFTKKALEVKQNNTKKEIIEKGKKSAIQNFPKVLLVYMPIFAFFLWLFHGKKRWYYFDHGIFTLHYFSFLLLIYLVIFIATRIVNLFGEFFVVDFLNDIIKFIGFLWMFYYFFPAHHRFYKETRFVSFVKSMSLFFINMIFIVLLLSLFFIYTLISIH